MQAYFDFCTIKTAPNFSNNKEERNALVSEVDYENVLEEVPTKDVPQNRKYYYESSRSEKTCGYRQNEVVDSFR